MGELAHHAVARHALAAALVAPVISLAHAAPQYRMVVVGSARAAVRAGLRVVPGDDARALTDPSQVLPHPADRW